MPEYDIHGILSIRSDEPILNPAFHRCFVTDRVDGPDIVIEAIDQRVETATLDRHDIWFYGSDNSDFIYYEDRLLGQHDRVLITGLQEETTTIEYDLLQFPDVVPGSRGSLLDVIESVIDWKLIERGCTTIHAASLENNGESVLLAGFPNVGKTLSALALLQKGWNYMGDDNGLISEDGTVYAYPSTSSIGYHDFLKYINPSAIGRARYLKHLLRVYPMQYAIVERLFDYPEIYLPDIGFEQADSATASTVACLQIGEKSIKRVSEEEMATKIISSTDYSRPRIWQNPFFQVWACFNSTLLSDKQRTEQRIINDFLQACECYTASCQSRNWGEILGEILLTVIKQ